jgi:hypothetical protein
MTDRTPQELAAPDLIALAHEIGKICHAYLRPVKGFTFHPCYIDVEAIAPIVEKLRTLHAQSASAFRAGLEKIRDEYRVNHTSKWCFDLANELLTTLFGETPHG